MVVKPLFGSEGRGLVRVTEFEVARRVFHALERIGSVLYLQRFIPNEGYDLRAFVLGNRVLGAIRRHAPDGDWRTNVAVGGRAEAVRLDAEAEALALRAARAVGARMAGVDLLPDREGKLVVLEVNAVPGWRALAACTGVDVASEILADLRGCPTMIATSPGTLAQVACLMEATARKPGNVHRFADFDGRLLPGFRPERPGDRPGDGRGAVDRRGRARSSPAVEATRRVVSTNTNLGMILLLAPLSAAFEPGGDLRSRRARRARRAHDRRRPRMPIARSGSPNPGGSARPPIRTWPTSRPSTLLDAMRMAADRDLVARQYATGYADVFEIALPALRTADRQEVALEEAIIRTHVVVLSRVADTLIVRKRGVPVAKEVSRRAVEALEGGDFAALDRFLREDGHARNPGATADLIAAALFAAMAEGTIACRGRRGRAGGHA